MSVTGVSGVTSTMSVVNIYKKSKLYLSNKMTKILNIFIIHSDELTNRVKYINSTVEMIKGICEKKGFSVNVSSINEPNKNFIDNKINIYNSRVKYEKEEGELKDDQFNNLINNLNVNQISNIEKCRSALNMINKGDELYFIMEDDVLIGTDYIDNLNTLISKLSDESISPTDWDILFTCMATIDNDSLKLVDSKDMYKFLVSKSSFFINAKTAKKLYEYLEIFKYNLKIGISKFIWNNKEIKSKVLNKHTFLEGSKMGIFPSSINGNNFLYQNMHFVNLAKLSNNDVITDDIARDALNIYKEVKNLDSADILHTMAIIYYKKGDFEESKKYFIDAYTSLVNNKGILSKSSEILNNAINIYKHDQKFLEECKKNKSKYTVE